MNKLPHHENFREYTKSELSLIKRVVCIGHKCPYMSFIGATNVSKNTDINSTRCCNYILYAGKRRDCMPDECTHYKDKGVKRRIKFNTSLEEI